MQNELHPRPEGPSDDGELARLAEEGQRRIHAASDGRLHAAQATANKHLLHAIGAVRGSRPRAIVPLIIVGTLTTIAGLGLTVLGTLTGSVHHLDTHGAIGAPVVLAGVLTAIGAFLFYLFVPPVATPAQVDAERAWVASMPFGLEGYFETLSAQPETYVRLEIQLAWQAVGVDVSMLRGVVGLLDTEAQVTSTQDGVTLATGKISGSTGVAVNRVPICGNHEVAKYLHKLVDVVLLPVHHNCPLTRVRVTRR
jgi:hypothetical protein